MLRRRNVKSGKLALDRPKPIIRIKRLLSLGESGRLRPQELVERGAVRVPPGPLLDQLLEQKLIAQAVLFDCHHNLRH